jgi:hypothetical protein
MFPDSYEEEGDTIRAVRPRPWTMAGAERIYALIQAVGYVSDHGIPGCIVGCGARTLLQKNDLGRDCICSIRLKDCRTQRWWISTTPAYMRQR